MARTWQCFITFTNISRLNRQALQIKMCRISFAVVLVCGLLIAGMQTLPSGPRADAGSGVERAPLGVVYLNGQRYLVYGDEAGQASYLKSANGTIYRETTFWSIPAYTAMPLND